MCVFMRVVHVCVIELNFIIVPTGISDEYDYGSHLVITRAVSVTDFTHTVHQWIAIPVFIPG